MIYFISKPFKIASHPRVVPRQGCANESRCVIVCFCTPSAFWLRCSTWLRGSSPATRFFSTPPSLSTPGNSTGRQKALSDCLNPFLSLQNHAISLHFCVLINIMHLIHSLFHANPLCYFQFHSPPPTTYHMYFISSPPLIPPPSHPSIYRDGDAKSSRHLFRFSLIYLPAILTFLLISKKYEDKNTAKKKTENFHSISSLLGLWMVNVCGFLSL